MKKYEVRQQQLVDIEANWNLTNGFIPLEAELIVYKPDEQTPYPRIKIGDGITDVKNLNFFSSSAGGGGSIELDSTLTDPLKAAQAQAVGEALKKRLPLELTENLKINGGSSEFSLQLYNVDLHLTNSNLDEEGVGIRPEGAKAQPKLQFYGTFGDESVELLNIADPTTENSAVNRRYVDDKIAIEEGVILLGDSTMKMPVYGEDNQIVFEATASIDGNPYLRLSENTEDRAIEIKGVATPSYDYAAANKLYVDSNFVSLVQFNKAIGDIGAALDGIIDIQNSILDGATNGSNVSATAISGAVGDSLQTTGVL